MLFTVCELVGGRFHDCVTTDFDDKIPWELLSTEEGWKESACIGNKDSGQEGAPFL